MTRKTVLKTQNKSDIIAKDISEQINNGLLKPGDRLMTVRQLSSEYGFNERTVLSALKSLRNEGLIEKTGKSYFITKKDELKAAQEIPHPFINLNGTSSGTRPIKFAVYENLPHQRSCWNELAETFTETNPGMSLEIDWLPAFINTVQMYHNFLNDEKIDLALLPEQIATEFLSHNIYAPLPDHIYQRISGPDYLSSSITRPNLKLNQYTAPVHFCMQAAIINHNTFSGKFILTPNGIEEFIDTILTVAGRLKSNALLTTFPWELATLQGLPFLMNLKELKPHLAELYENLTKFSSVKDKISWKMFPAEEAYREYASGNIMLYIGALTMLLPLLEKTDFTWTGNFFQVPEKNFLPCGLSSIAITKHASGATETAVDFLTSQMAQGIIAKHRLNFSCYLETNRPLLKKMQADEKQFLVNIKKLVCNETDITQLHSIIVLELKNTTQRVINQEITPTTAVKEAMAYIKRLYPEKMN